MKFQTVFWGLALQFYFALLILRTSVGYNGFNWLGKRISEFLDHTDAGVEFVFGEAYVNHYFALKVCNRFLLSKVVKELKGLEIFSQLSVQ